MTVLAAPAQEIITADIAGILARLQAQGLGGAPAGFPSAEK